MLLCPPRWVLALVRRKSLMRLAFFAKGLAGASSEPFRGFPVRVVCKPSNNSTRSVILGCFSVFFLHPKRWRLCSLVCAGSLIGMGCKCHGFTLAFTSASKVLLVALWQSLLLAKWKVDLHPEQTTGVQTTSLLKIVYFLRDKNTYIWCSLLDTFVLHILNYLKGYHLAPFIFLPSPWIYIPLIFFLYFLTVPFSPEQPLTVVLHSWEAQDWGCACSRDVTLWDNGTEGSQVTALEKASHLVQASCLLMGHTENSSPLISLQ